MNQEIVDKLKEIKNAKIAKKYNDGVPEEHIHTVGEWMVSFVREETPVHPQDTLAVSRVDKNIFYELEDIKRELPEIWEVFRPVALGIDTYANRGRTFLFIMNDKAWFPPL